MTEVAGEPVPSFLCPVIVGRGRELEMLGRHLAGTGPPVLLLAGEAGIGKSRLVREARARAAQSGMRVVQGMCYEPDRTAPYAPILDLLRALPVGDDGNDDVITRRAAADLVLQFPGLNRDATGSVPPGEADAEWHKRRVWGAVTDLVLALAAHSPVLVVMEDLHWSDESSLELLGYLVRHTAGAPVRFLFSYRSDEQHEMLAHVLADLERERLAQECSLSRLTPAELQEMMRATLGPRTAIPPEVAERFHRLTDGNPFFVEEALKALAELGDLSASGETLLQKAPDALRIPRTIHDAVQRRASRLTAGARAALATAAVIGHRFDFALLLRLLQAQSGNAATCPTGADLIGWIKEMMAHQLVVETDVDRFSFRHALTREAIYADLLGREQRAIHRVIAAALEEGDTDIHRVRAPDLAYHYFAGELWDRALIFCRMAGEQALAVYAPRAAVEQLTRALEACERGAVPATWPIYRGRGNAYEQLGNFKGALADYEQTLALARSARDLEGEWQALLDLALLWSSRDYARVGGLVERALETARRSGDPARIAHALNRLGNWYTNVERAHEGLACHREALTLFERLENIRGIAETLDFLGMTNNIISDHIQSAACYARARPLLEEIGDRQRLVTGLTMWMLQSGFYLSETAPAAPLSPAEALQSGERAIVLAGEMDWPAGEAFTLYELALWLGPRGRYTRALQAAHAAAAIAKSIGHQQWLDAALCTLGALHLDLLDFTGAEEYLEQGLALARTINSSLWTRLTTAFLVPVYLQQGRREQAEALLDEALARDASMETIMQRLCWRARAQLALAGGDAPSALAIIDRLIATVETATAAQERPSANPRVIPALRMLRAEALVALDRPAEAEQVLGEARDEARAQVATALLWRIHLALGRVLHRRGHRKEARAAFEAARALVEEISADIAEEPLRTTFQRHALALLPPPRPLSPARAARERFGGLTGREREVALRIAQGKSNRVIAAEMVVTERTIEGYVSTILGKLGFDSRAQIAAWTVEHGLRDFV